MRDQITQYLATRDDVAFPELMQVIPESSGDRTLFNDHDNLIVWEGMSQVFVETIESLMRDSSITLRPVSHMTIIHVHAFGQHPTLDYPVANRVQNYPKLHWIPALICRGDNFPRKS